MVSSKLQELKLPLSLKEHQTFNLIIHSQVLTKNPLRDPNIRHNYILAPKKSKGPMPLIFHLSGYLSTGYQSFYKKPFKANFVEKIDQGVRLKKHPKAVHVFVEAGTFWGGSQFINSPGCGLYEDYILKELFTSVEKNFEISKQDKKRCVMGASSGGYGALSLTAGKRSPFGTTLAVSPDSFFEASLLPELFRAAPDLIKYKSFSKIKKQLTKEDFQNNKNFFPLVNTVAMGHCYSPKEAFNKDFLDWPIDLYSGKLKPKRWKQWLEHDPLFFLKKKKDQLKGKSLYLEVGQADDFSLQFGARQMAHLLKTQGIKHEFREFVGDHSGLSQRRLLFLEKLKSLWAD